MSLLQGVGRCQRGHGKREGCLGVQVPSWRRTQRRNIAGQVGRTPACRRTFWQVGRTPACLRGKHTTGVDKGCQSTGRQVLGADPPQALDGQWIDNLCQPQWYAYHEGTPGFAPPARRSYGTPGFAPPALQCFDAVYAATKAPALRDTLPFCHALVGIGLPLEGDSL
jgi:hypothetical protein